MVVGMFPHMQINKYNTIYKQKDKNHMIISLDEGKASNNHYHTK
jgi:hypothetical protein